MEDIYVALARKSLTSFIKTGRRISVPEGLPEDMTGRRAGVFVSLHKDGALRGCIGTLAPTMSSVAEEIIENAISAATRDPRFPEVREDEIEGLEISVDVLGPMEPVKSKKDLDPVRYGVVVTKGFKRGLLLPDLDGVDTVDYQISIAKQKAGIDPLDTDVELERFEVVRHI